MITTTSTSKRAERQDEKPEFDVWQVRGDFPILETHSHDKLLAYLDNAATTQKPRAVIDAVSRYYEQSNANIHRGVYDLSVRATESYEKVRGKVRRFIGAARNDEIIFVRGTTEAINLVAQSYGRANVGSGDEVIVSEMEHHSNIVPWQLLCEQVGAKLRVAPINDAGELRFDEYVKLLNERTKIVAVGHVSNALGSINPVAAITAEAHRHGAVMIVDGAQGVPHMNVDVRELDCDFYAFSAHKMFGPTGIGVLYGKRDLLEAMPPYQAGGDMIRSVSFDKTIFNDLPHKFEAGTPNIAGVMGLGAAVDYLSGIGLQRVAAYETELLEYATRKLSALPQVRLIGTAKEKTAVVSFVVDGIHPHDLGTILDEEGVAIRTGHHCAQPVMEHFGVPATSRASLAFYNTKEEIDRLVAGVIKAIEVFA